MTYRKPKYKGDLRFSPNAIKDVQDFDEESQKRFLYLADYLKRHGMIATSTFTFKMLLPKLYEFTNHSAETPEENSFKLILTKDVDHRVYVIRVFSGLVSDVDNRIKMDLADWYHEEKHFRMGNLDKYRRYHDFLKHLPASVKAEYFHALFSEELAYWFSYLEEFAKPKGSFNVKEIAERTGFDLKVVQAYLDLKCIPSYEHMAIIARCYDARVLVDYDTYPL